MHLKLAPIKCFASDCECVCVCVVKLVAGRLGFCSVV